MPCVPLGLGGSLLRVFHPPVKSLQDKGTAGEIGPDGEIEIFDSVLQMTMTGTGALAGYSRSLTVPLACEAHTGPRILGDPVQTFPNDMFLLDGELFGDPDGGALRIMLHPKG